MVALVRCRGNVCYRWTRGIALVGSMACQRFTVLHYHLWNDSPLWVIAFLLWISWQQDFYGVGLSTPRPTPNLEDQASVFVTPGDTVTQLYPQALGTDFSCLLRHAWAALGLFLSSGHHTEDLHCYIQTENIKQLRAASNECTFTVPWVFW
jgi:hypothetical protein